MENIITLEMTSDLFHIISVGTYGTGLSSDDIFRNTHYDLSKAGQNLFWDNFDNKLYMECILECAKKEILKNESEIKELLKPIGFLGFVKDSFSIYSPQSYNYTNDTLYFDINLDLSLFTEYVKGLGLNNDFDNFLNETYKSSNGYFNFMPESYNEVLEVLEKLDDMERLFGAILTYFVKDNIDYIELIKDIEYMFYDVVYEIGVNNVISDKKVLKKIEKQFNK